MGGVAAANDLALHNFLLSPSKIRFEFNHFPFIKRKQQFLGDRIISVILFEDL